MNLRPALLFCATLATLAPCCARPVDPALEARLRAQILELSPLLTDNGNNPQDDDELALPMAQLGDAATANQLASTQLTRDGIAQWRAEQRAMRGEWSGASAQAASVRDAPVRADSFLVIARLAAEKRDFATARPALKSAMSALDKAPDAAQLSYAAWIWWRIGDVAASQRVFIEQAWPAAQKQDESDEKLFGLKSTAFPASAGHIVTQFAARCGLLRAVVQSVDPDKTLPTQWLLNNVNTSDDFQFLFDRAMKTETDGVGLYTLAVVLAQHKRFDEARQVRERAQDLSAQSAPEANYGYPSYLQLLLALELGEQESYATIARDWARRSQDKRAPENVALLPQMARIFRSDDSDNYSNQYTLRRAATRAEIDDYADAILASPTAINEQNLPVLLDYYAQRDPARVRALAAAFSAKLAAKATEIEVGQASGESFSWNNPASLVAQLRDLGFAAESATLRETLIEKTPPIFRSSQAQDFLRNGFVEAASQTFDPLQYIASQARLADNAPQGQRFTFDWDDYAATEARYRAADAPARWFGALGEPRQRATVLKGWINGLTPQLKLSPPYVKRTVSIRQGYGVSGSSEY